MPETEPEGRGRLLIGNPDTSLHGTSEAMMLDALHQASPDELLDHPMAVVLEYEDDECRPGYERDDADDGVELMGIATRGSTELRNIIIESVAAAKEIASEGYAWASVRMGPYAFRGYDGPLDYIDAENGETLFTTDDGWGHWGPSWE